jgi:hypothetical protein
MDVTYIRKAEATGRVEIRTESMAREIEVDGSGKAEAVVYIDKDGREQRVYGRAIVVAGNAVETPRLLLMSTSNRFPDGLANPRPRRPQLHGTSGGLRFRPVRPSGRSVARTPSANHPGQLRHERRNGFARGWTTLVTANSHWP